MRNSDTYRQQLAVLIQGFSRLPDKPEETAESTLDALWNLAAGNCLVVERALQSQLPELTISQLEHLAELVQKRFSGIPLGHLTGKQRFMGLDLDVSADALIPRKETELLGYGALGLIQEMAAEKDPVLVVDICTGAGNLSLAFAHHEPKVRVFGSDLSPEAAALAQRNAQALNLGNRVEFCSGDLLEPFRTEDFLGKIDVLTCNPPYISSGKLVTMPHEIIGHEPDMAFNGGPFGISILSRLVKETPAFVRKGGWLAFEVGAGQGPGLERMLQKNPSYGEIQTIADVEERIRAILVQLA